MKAERTTTILLARSAAQASEDAPNQAGRIMLWLEGMPVLTGAALLLFAAAALYYLVLAVPRGNPALPPAPAK
ncbi:hypothetical protein IIA16_04225 [bacterium]|nr:hypothetical protein [bacterium]